MSPKLYVLVDSQIGMSHQAVQAGHAIAEWCQKYPLGDWYNGTLVILKTHELEKYRKHAEAEFIEPDMGHRLTAIAFLGKGELVKDLPLL
jgi:hypothetical protein